jgi:hypothetical protein
MQLYLSVVTLDGQWRKRLLQSSRRSGWVGELMLIAVLR